MHTILLSLAIVAIGTCSCKQQNAKVTDLVYLDIEVDGSNAGRIVIGLFGEIVPKTSRNFVALANHEIGFGYRGTKLYMPSKKFYSVMGGRVGVGNETHKSFYGEEFENENFDLKHYGPGWVSMVPSVYKKNGAAFQITFREHDEWYTTWWDNQHVVFGAVIKGLDIVYMVSTLDIDRLYGGFIKNVTIANSGSLPMNKAIYIPRKPIRKKDNRKMEL